MTLIIWLRLCRLRRAQHVKIAMTTGPRKSDLFAACLAFVAITGFANASFAARLVAQWKLNEASAPYADSSGNGIALNQDSITAPALRVEGIEGAAAFLRWQNPPGVSTRLYVFNGALQTDSFGFSFWLNPSQLSPGQNLIAKEMPFNNTIPNFTRMAWQVKVGGNNGSGAA